MEQWKRGTSGQTSKTTINDAYTCQTRFYAMLTNCNHVAVGISTNQRALFCTSYYYCFSHAHRFVFNVDSAHGPSIRSLDFNPNKPHHFASAGDDCSVKFWDSRKLAAPLAVRQDHSHWVWSVQFNLFHDQLILTSSSDSQVLLTRMSSIASEPLQPLYDEEEEQTE